MIFYVCLYIFIGLCIGGLGLICAGDIYRMYVTRLDKS